ncbi:gas vesicle protein GvpG [Methylocystis sp. Sn-Cys]|uniref:gas vesicle protein GvpG n=1 Tax=Methylocystis sp. Sn-Cys TaxID=1701263 RepID=UPI0019244DED|nr:gas vesicle protein GvpG [Methylocystis sp. Sn-Cys]MBL1258024.1 gas vesicle protein GvpG [Methylocystis sp. Sn-Cys]
MLLIDDLLAAPMRGLLFVLEKIDEAARQEREAEERAIMAELSELYRALETGALTEAEFDAREGKLLTRLDSLHGKGAADVNS